MFQPTFILRPKEGATKAETKRRMQSFRRYTLNNPDKKFGDKRVAQRIADRATAELGFVVQVRDAAELEPFDA